MADDKTATAELVARYLSTNGYSNTLAAFLQEAALPKSAAETRSPDILTVEKLLEEKRAFDKSLTYEKVPANGDELEDWASSPVPSKGEVIFQNNGGNVLCITSHVSKDASYVLASTADRSIWRTEISANGELESTRRLCALDSPILTMAVLSDGGIVLAGGMSGKLTMLDSNTGQIFSEKKLHSKYLVKIVAIDWNSNGYLNTLVATAGWDRKIVVVGLGRLFEGVALSGTITGEPTGVELKSDPEDICFTQDPWTNLLYLLVARKDSTKILFYNVYVDFPQSTEPVCAFRGEQNLAPHSNAWVAFSPSSISPCPSDPSLLAVATSSTPHMKVMVVRLLFPQAASSAQEQPAQLGAAAYARAELEKQNKEEAAIVLNVNSMAPQTRFSTPQCGWRANGSGVWVNGDDGTIRGIDRATGKVQTSLAKVHDPEVKIRTINILAVNNKEMLLSGGFDSRFVAWTS